MGTDTKRLSSFLFDERKRLNIQEEYTPPIPAPKIEVKKIDTSIYTNKITSPIVPLSKGFLETMQLSKIFKEDYQNHRAIKIYDQKHEVIFFENSEKKINIRYKWNGTKKIDGWYTFKGLGNIGGVFYGANAKRSTLVMVEGLKDGLNANIALPQCDILVSDSKTTQYDFDLINTDDYKTIILFHDNRIEPNKLIKQFETLKGKERTFFKKTKYVDYKKLPANISDLTDFLQSLNLTAKKLKRGALKAIKEVLHSTDTLKQIENDIEIDEKLSKIIENAKKFNNMPLFKELIKKKLLLNGDITEDIKWYVQRKVSAPKNATLLSLNSSKFLSHIDTQIVDLFKTHSKVMLGSPTGTGKSHFTRENLTQHFKNMIIIAPLKKVALELSESERVNITHLENNEKYEAVLANINAPYISMTTDMFYTLIKNKKYSDIIEQRLSECELIVFDEQHIVEQSQNFRGKVVATFDFLRDRYNGKVLMMSGTPIYSDLPNFHAIQAKLSDRFMSTIDYCTDPFKDEKELIKAIKEELKNGNVLAYSDSTLKGKYIYNYLRELGINTLLVHSREKEEDGVKTNENLYNGRALKDAEINNIKENIVIVSTTKATTGVNFKNLSVIFQFGTVYDTNTFIQLMARIRGNGRYYFIKLLGNKAQDEQHQNKAINILKTAKKFDLKNISSMFQQNQEYIKQHIELPFKKYDLKTFLGVYRKALQLIEGEEIGKLTEDRKDFNFTDRLGEIADETINKIFINGDSVEFTKYIEREMIDFLQRKSNVEILNSAYNLSFRIVHKNIEINYDEIESKLLLTVADAEEKQAIADERKENKNEFQKAIEQKFEWFLNSKNKKEFFKEFGAGELSRLLEDNRINEEKYQKKILAIRETKGGEKISKTKNQLTAIKFFSVSRGTVIKKAYQGIEQNGQITINELSTIIEQEVYLTTKTSKSPFSNFIKDFLESDEFSKDNLELKNKMKVDGKHLYNVVTLPKEKLKEFKKIKKTKEREKARLLYIEEQQKKLESYYEIVTTDRKDFYSDEVIEQIESELRVNNFEPKEEYRDNESKYNYEIIFEDKIAPTIPNKQELERTISDDKVSFEVRARAMQQLAILEREV